MRHVQGGFLGASLIVASAALAADQIEISLELNKLEATSDACRFYVLASNRSESAFSTLQADLVTFGGDGVINGRIAVELAPFEAAKTALRLFDLPGVDCASITRILLNEMPRCETAAGPLADCTRITTPRSLVAGVDFFK